MKLPHEFYKLPLCFDAKRLAQEVLSFQADDWIPHPDGFTGNCSIPLISLNGELNNAFNGPMKPTQALLNSPYLQQVIASFGEVFGRSRLMRLAPGQEVPSHTDTNYHWFHRVRIHIPIITDEDVLFYVGDKHVHMGAGETWIFDSWKHHHVENNGQTNRVHLVIDTSGSSKFWRMIEQSGTPKNDYQLSNDQIKHLPFSPQNNTQIFTENFNSPLVMSPGELDGMLSIVMSELRAVPANNQDGIAQVNEVLQQFSQDWRHIWYVHADKESGWMHYQKLRMHILRLSESFSEELVATNLVEIALVLKYCVIAPALNVELANFK